MALDYLNRKDTLENTMISNFKLIREMEGYGEGVAGALAGAAGSIGKGTFKASLAVGKGAYNKFTPERVKFIVNKIAAIIKKILGSIKKMIQNLYNLVLGADKRLASMLDSLKKSIGKASSGRYPKVMKIIDLDSLNEIGLNNQGENTRITIMRNFLNKIKEEGSLLKDLDFSSKENIMSSIGSLLTRLNGSEVKDVTPESITNHIRNNLYIFDGIEKQKKSKKTKTNVFSWNKETAISEVKKTLKKYAGNEVYPVLEEVIRKLIEIIEPISKLQVVEFLRGERENVDKLENAINKYLEEFKKAEFEKAEKEKASVEYKNKQQPKQIESGKKEEPKEMRDVTDSAVSSKGESLLMDFYDSIGYFGYAEGIYGDNNSNSNNSTNNKEGGEGELPEEAEALKTLLVEYSKSLNNTIGNISKFYGDLIFVSKKTLNDYFKVTK